MNLDFDLSLAKSYKSNSQRIRVLTENWCEKELFCPCCGDSLKRHQNNTPVGDFYCLSCHENFELKSSKSLFKGKVPAGAYNAVIDKIKTGKMPHFFFLHYETDRVKNLIAVPKQFFIPELIEKRNPLKACARRAGWTGCNILLPAVPRDGKVFIVTDGTVSEKNNIIKRFNQIRFLEKASSKGWLIDVMKCIDMAGKTDFLLTDIYDFEDFLSERHPDNRHVRPKIRQQLQFLRNSGYLEFCGRGRYRRI